MGTEGTELAKAYVQIIPSAKGIKGSISNVLGGEADSSGKTLGSGLASAMKTAIAAAGLGQAIKSALSEGAALQQSLGGVETLFKDSAEKVAVNAEIAYKTAGMSANEYMEAVTGFSASLLQGLGGDTAKAADVADMALTDMSDNANKMGTSMELIQNAYQGFAKQNYTMLDNLKLGYGGTKTEMERLLADAEAFSGVKYDINNLGDVYEAIHVIQEEMEITGTTAKEAASTYAGSLATMQAAGKNVLADLSLGRDVSKSLKAFTQSVFTFVGKNFLPMLGNVLKGLPDIFTVAFEAAIDGLNEIAGNASGIVESGVTLVQRLATSVLNNIPFLAEGAVNLIAGFGEALINTDWMGVASEMITAFNESMVLVSTEIFGTEGSFLDGLLSSITNGLPLFMEQGSAIITNIGNGIFNSIPDILLVIGDVIAEIAAFLLENLPVFLEQGVQLITNLASGIVQNIPAALLSMAEVIANILATIAENLPEVLESGLSLIGEIAAGIIAGIPDLLKKLPEVFKGIKEKFAEFDWLEIGKNIIEGIAKGIVKFASKIIEAAKEAAASALKAAKEALGIKSPSRVFRDEVGKWIPYGEAEGILQNADVVRSAIKKLSQESVGVAKADVSYSTGISRRNIESDVSGREEMEQRLMDIEEALLIIVRILSEGLDVQWDERNLGRLVRKYA